METQGQGMNEPSPDVPTVLHEGSLWVLPTVNNIRIYYFNARCERSRLLPYFPGLLL